MTNKISMLYYNMGLEMIRSGRVQDAMCMLKKSVSLKDTNVEAWNLLGLCYYKVCRLEMAQYCWNQSLKIDSIENDAQRYIKELQPIIKEAKEIDAKVRKLVLEKNFKQADKLFEGSVLKQNLGECSEVKNFEGILKRLSGDRKKALNLWESALQTEDKISSDTFRYIASEREKKSLFSKVIYTIFKR